MKQTQRRFSAVIMIFLLIGVLLLDQFFNGNLVIASTDSMKENIKISGGRQSEYDDDNIMDVTDQMMAYLIGKEAELSVITDVDGETQDFFNEQDRFHMGEVKDLFLGGLKIRNIMLVAVLLILILLAARKADLIKLLPRAYFVTLGITGMITVVLGGLFASDFDKYFRIFHEIFFDNDQWMFDPATDYMIRMLPEGFIYDFVFRIGGFFVGSLAVLGVVFAVCIFMEKRKKKN